MARTLENAAPLQRRSQGSIERSKAMGVQLEHPSENIEINEMMEGITREIHQGFLEQGLPDYMYPGVIRWVLYGSVPGDFLCSLLQNNLKDSFAYADDLNKRSMTKWVLLLYSCIPSMCQGGRGNFESWREAGGLKGRLEADAERQEPV